MIFPLSALWNIGLLHANIPDTRLLDPKACKGDTITPPGVDQKQMVDENVSPAQARSTSLDDNIPFFKVFG